MPPGTSMIAQSRPFTTLEAIRQIFLRWYVLLPVALGGSVGAFFLKRTVLPAYTSTAAVRLLPATIRPQIEAGVQLPREDRVDTTTLADSLQELVLVTSSLQQLLRDHPALFRKVGTSEHEFITWLRRGSRIQYKGGNIYSIATWGRDPEQARASAHWMALAAMNAYKKILREKAETLAKFTKDQATVAEKELTRHEETMIAFLRKNPGLLITALDRDRRLAATGPDRMRVKAMLTRAGSALTAKDPALRALLEERERLQAELRGFQVGDTPSSAGATMLRELDAAKRRLEELKAGGRSDADPTVKIAQRQVVRLERELKQLKPGEGGATQVAVKTRARIKEIDRKVKAGLRQPQSSPRLEAQWGEKLRKQTLLVKHFEGFNRLASLAAFDFGLGLFETKDLALLVTDASQPKSPQGIKPWMVLAAGIFFSCLLAIGLAIAFGRLDRKIYSTEELKELVRLPLLAELPHQRPRDALRASDEERGQSDRLIAWSKKEEVLEVGIKLSNTDDLGGAATPGAKRDRADGRGLPQRLALPAHEQALQAVGTSMVLSFEAPTINICVRSVIASPPLAPGLFLVTAPRTSGADQVRLLAGRLMDEKMAPYRVVLITSWEPQAGRTTVAANLALAFAEARRRVLLIDTCSGDRSLTRMLSLRPEEGTALYEQLTARMNGVRSTWTVYRLAETLSIIPAGAVTAALGPMLSAVVFGDLIEHCRAIFDVVVIDSRPLGSVSDAAILSQKADALIPVVRRRSTKLPGLQQLVDQVGNRPLIGTVFNRH